MKTGIVYDPIYLEHRIGTHIESHERLIGIMDFLEEQKVLENPDFPLIQPRKATKEQIRENLSSEKGKELRKRRGFEVETPFGDFKRNCSFSRFHLRGLPKIEHEFGLLCIAYNLRKIYFKELKKAA